MHAEDAATAGASLSPVRPPTIQEPDGLRAPRRAAMHASVATCAEPVIFAPPMRPAGVGRRQSPRRQAHSVRHAPAVRACCLWKRRRASTSAVSAAHRCAARTAEQSRAEGCVGRHYHVRFDVQNLRARCSREPRPQPRCDFRGLGDGERFARSVTLTHTLVIVLGLAALNALCAHPAQLEDGGRRQ